MLEARNLSVGYADKTILEDISVLIAKEDISVLVGANGSGKSTLLKALAGLHPLKAGQVHLDGEVLHHLPRREVASKIAVLSQSPQAPEGLTVYQLVEHGQFAQRRFFEAPDPDGVMAALDFTGMSTYAHRPFEALSGGEQQRVWISLALAQKPQMLLLDEPTSYLDMGHQIDVLELLKRLHREQGIGMLMVLHDINHASLYADRIMAIREGAILADGAPSEIVTSELVRALFGAEVSVLSDPTGQHPYCVPKGRLKV